MTTRVTTALLASLLLATPLAAQKAFRQKAPDAPPRFSVGLTALYGAPAGEFADYVDRGFGLDGSFTYRLDRAGWLGLRADLGFVVYGHEAREVCLSATVGCRVTLDLTTSNTIVYGGVGPQIMVPVGPVRPYADAAISFGYFGTTSSLSDDSDSEPFASTNNFDDATVAWSGGGGVLIPVYGGKTPVALDLAARFHRNGPVSYLREGDIQDNPDGSITLFPTESEADLWTMHLGVRIGVG